MDDLGATCQIPRIGKLEIEKRVEELLDECWDGAFPIEIETICDYLGVGIMPLMGLHDKFGVDSFISADFKNIYVDESGFRKDGNRYRFSVAHEIGHFVLHREYYSSRVESLDDWAGVSAGGGCGYVEYQANYYAGCLLAPEDEMMRALNYEYDGSFARNYFIAGRRRYVDALAKLRRLFRVSEQVIVRRMRDTVYGLEVLTT